MRERERGERRRAGRVDGGIEGRREAGGGKEREGREGGRSEEEIWRAGGREG